MMTPDEVRRTIAEKAITAQGPLDSALPAVSGATQPVFDAMPEIVTPSAVGGTVGAIAGSRMPAVGPRVGSGIGTALGRAVETIGEGGGIGSAVLGLPIGYAEGYGSEMLGEKVSSIWQAGKARGFNKAFRRSPFGLPPSEGSLAGRAIDDAVELHEWGKFMGREIDRDAAALQAAGGKPALSPKEIARLKEGVFTPAQLTEGDLLDQVEAAGSSSMTGGAVRRFKQMRERAWTAYADVYKRSLGKLDADPQTLAKFLKDKMEAVFDARSGHISAAYEDVFKLAGDRTVDLAPAKASLATQVADWEARAAVSPDRQKIAPIIARIKRFTSPVFDPATGAKIGDNSIPITLRQTQQLRSDWLEMRRMLKETSSKAKGVTSDAITEIDAAMDTVLKRASADMGITGKGSLDRRYRAANMSFKRMKEQTNRLQLDALVDLVDKKKAGKEAIDTIIPGGISGQNIALLRDTLGGAQSEGWGKVRRWYGESLLDRHMSGGSVNFRGLLDELQHLGGGKSGEIRRMLGADYHDTLKMFARTGLAANKGNPVGNKVAINIAETGAMLSLPASVGGAFGDNSRKGALLGAAIFVPMAVVNRWLANPKSAELVLKGMSGKASAPIARELSALLARTIAEEGTDSLIAPVPRTATLEELRARKSAQAPQRSTYGGVRG